MSTRITQRITPFLWFADQAEEAAEFYTSIFRNSKLGDNVRYDEEAAKPTGRKPGSVMVIEFQLDGQDFVALNGGPMFKFTEAISLQVNCRTQKEIDTYWTKLSRGGKPGVCGWLKDKFGLSWQIVPRRFTELIRDRDPRKVKAVMEAMMTMVKLDVAELERAYNEA